MAQTLEDIRRELARLEPIHRQLKEEAIFILESALKEARIKYHSSIGRIKTADSVVKKLERKQLTTLKELNDLVGVRIVCLFLSDIKKIGNLIREQFDVQDEDNKIEHEDVASFGYMSHHFILKMKKGYSGPRYDPIRDLRFEIQVRTIAMDAWAATSHYLDYKSEQDVPTELRKDFFALSGLFYVADQHFEMFFKSRQQSRRSIEIGLEKTLSGEMNLDSLQEYLRKRFPDRNPSGPTATSQLLKELRAHGYSTIDEIEEIVRKTLKAALKYEEDIPPHGVAGHKYEDVGIMRGIFDIWDKEFAKSRRQFLAKNYVELIEEG